MAAATRAVKNVKSPPAPQLNVITQRLRHISQAHKEEFAARLPDEDDLRAFVALMDRAVETDDPEVWDAALAAYMHAQKLDAPEKKNQMWWGQFASGVTLGKHYFYPVMVGLAATAPLLLSPPENHTEAFKRSAIDASIALAAAFIEPWVNSIAFIAHVPPSDRNMRTTADIAETLATPMLRDANKTMSQALELAKKAIERPAGSLETAIQDTKKAIEMLVKGRHEWQMRSKLNTVYYGGYSWQSIPKGAQAYVNAGSIGVALKYGTQTAGYVQLGGALAVMAVFQVLSGYDKVALESNMQPLNMLDAYKKIDLGPAAGEEGHDPDKVRQGQEKYAKRIRTEWDVRQVQARQRLWIDMRKYAMMSANLLNAGHGLLNRKSDPIQPDEWIRYTNLSERLGHLPALDAAETAEYQRLDARVGGWKAQQVSQRDPKNKKEMSPQEKQLATLERMWAQTEIDPTDLQPGMQNVVEAAATLVGMEPNEWQRWANLNDRADLPRLRDKIEPEVAQLSDDGRQKLGEWRSAWLETRPDLDKIAAKDYGEVSDRNKPMVDRLLEIAEYKSPAWRAAKNIFLFPTEEFHSLLKIGFGRVSLPEEIIAPIALSYWYFFHFVVGGPVFPMAVGATMGVADNYRRMKADEITSVSEREQKLATIDSHAHYERYALIAFIATVQLAGALASMALARTQVGKKNTWADVFNTMLGTNSEHQIGSLTAFFLFCRAKSRADQAWGKFQQIGIRGAFTKEYAQENKEVIASGLFLLGQEGWAGFKGKKLVSEVNQLLPQLRDMLQQMEGTLETQQANGAPPSELAALEAEIQEVRGLCEDVEAAIGTFELAGEMEANEALQGENPSPEILEAEMSRSLPGASSKGPKTVGELVELYKDTHTVLTEATKQADEEIKRELAAAEQSEGSARN